MAVASKKGRAHKARPFSQRSPLRRFWENFKALASALVFFIFLRAFFLEAYRIPSGSMIPTLLVGDWLFVNKLVYGPHVPFTNYNLPGITDPRRGDVVVFKSPTQTDQPSDPNPTLVKRLVGVPGDTLYMRNGLLYVNGIAQRQGFAQQKNEGVMDSIDPLFDWQKPLGLKSSRFGPAPAQPTHDNWGPIIVPPGNSARISVFIPTGISCRTRQSRAASESLKMGAPLIRVPVSSPSKRSCSCPSRPEKRSEISRCSSERILTANAPEALIMRCVRLPVCSEMMIIGGSSETEVNELTVMPCLPLSSTAVTIVTPELHARMERRS